MRTELELNELILEITTDIRNNYPELVKFLNEKAVTIPYQEHPAVTVEILSSQYELLVNLMDEYQKNGIESVQLMNVINMPIIEIKTIEHDNSYPDLLTKINNFTVSYNDAGEGTMPIIFLHGFPFDKSMWNLQLDALKSAHRVIAVDLRGFGQSTDELSVLTMDLFGQDLIAFMDKLEIKKAVICGLSMGGYIALNAIKNFPNRFEALILCDTQCNADTHEGKEKRYETIKQINNDGPATFHENFIKGVFHPNSFSTKSDVVENLRNVVIGNSKELLSAGLQALAEREETCSSLKDIHVPTLIICGKQDQLTPVEKSKAMHQQIKGSVLKIIDEAGHVSNLEQPEEFNKHLSDFLKHVKNSF